MIKNTSYNVRPDRHTSAEIALLKPEEGVIVYDTDLKVNMYWNGLEWFYSSRVATTGFMDYNDTTGDVTLTSDTWTDVLINKK